MELPRKQAETVRKALEHWRDEGLLDEATGKRLLDDLVPMSFDWHRLGRYAMWTSVACILIGVVSLFTDRWLIEFIERFITLTGLGRCVLLCLAAAGLFVRGARLRARSPEKRLTSEAVFFLGVMAVAGALGFFADWLRDYAHVYDLGSGFFHGLFLIAALVYGVLGLTLDSRMIWIFSLLSIGSWLGTRTGYDAETYALHMPYPTHFTLFGLVLCGLSALMKRSSFWPRLAAFERSTLSMGLLYLFVSLWLMSIFGRDCDLTAWMHDRHMALLSWSLLFGAAACAAIWIGVRRDDGMLRGYGLVFLFLNLYTRFFEYFWSSLNKGLFFLILGVTFWVLHSHAQRLWNLGKKNASSPKD